MVSINTITIFAFSAVALAAPTTTAVETTGNWETYPDVPKTASINGFADPIYSDLPECAKDCVDQDTGVTPCPYWDAGCLCVMMNFAGDVADCVASACTGSPVAEVTSLATSLCSEVGVPSPYWFIPLTASAALVEAEATE